MNGKTRNGFTIVEIVLVGFLIGLGALAAIGTRVAAGDTANRVKCASNLRMIGQACLLYANENNGFYPRTKHDMTVEKWTAYTKYNAKDPFADDGPEVNDVTAAMFLLVRTEDITSEVFICPSSSATKFEFGGGANTALDCSNFDSKAHLSYSYATPYKKEEQHPLTSAMNAEFAVAGDMNPGGDNLTKLTPPANAPTEKSPGNSQNHHGDGQNVLYGDGHVEFCNTPFVGVNRDNIYTFGDSGTDKGGGEGVIGPSIGANDSILLPTAQQEPPKEK
jgi:prepilin-type processing-associated H-X9-DG protein